MADAALLQELGELLRLLDGDRAHQHRLSLAVAGDDVVHHRVELLPLRLVDDVRLVEAGEPAIGGGDGDVELVDLGELVGLGLRGARHARELGVHAEVVLEGDGGQGLVLALDAHPFLGLHRLMEAVGPAPARHEAPGELVDDDDLPVLDHVVDVAAVEGVRAQGLLDVVQRGDVLGVVEVVDVQEPLAASRSPAR